jgi:hypothetical protein
MTQIRIEDLSVVRLLRTAEMQAVVGGRRSGGGLILFRGSTGPTFPTGKGLKAGQWECLRFLSLPPGRLHMF